MKTTNPLYTHPSPTSLQQNKKKTEPPTILNLFDTFPRKLETVKKELLPATKEKTSDILETTKSLLDTLKHIKKYSLINTTSIDNELGEFIEKLVNSYTTKSHELADPTPPKIDTLHLQEIITLAFEYRVIPESYTVQFSHEQSMAIIEEKLENFQDIYSNSVTHSGIPITEFLALSLNELINLPHPKDENNPWPKQIKKNELTRKRSITQLLINIKFQKETQPKKEKDAYTEIKKGLTELTQHYSLEKDESIGIKIDNAVTEHRDTQKNNQPNKIDKLLKLKLRWEVLRDKKSLIDILKTLECIKNTYETIHLNILGYMCPLPNLICISLRQLFEFAGIDKDRLINKESKNLLSTSEQDKKFKEDMPLLHLSLFIENLIDSGASIKEAEVTDDHTKTLVEDISPKLVTQPGTLSTSPA